MMQRRLLYTPERVHAMVARARDEAWAEARGELHEMHAHHLREIDELRSIVKDVVKTLRTQAEGDLADLRRRQCDLALARLERRDGRPLH